MFVLDSDNSTSERVWHPNVTTRGTWTIYQSCIITIGLCVWQSIHLNIPPPHEEWYKQTMRKVGFALTALIAPEFVALIAWCDLPIDPSNELTAKIYKVSILRSKGYRESRE